MKERPILFSAPMVRAILDGQKTQTRRVIKAFAGRPLENLREEGASGNDVSGEFNDPFSWGLPFGEDGVGDISLGQWPEFYPYEVSGRLWVREAWAVSGIYSDVTEVRYRASENRAHSEFAEQFPNHCAGYPKVRATWPKYKPSIHMPRWACRIELEITGIRAERLKDITEADAAAEGAEECDHAQGLIFADHRTAFLNLWEQINGTGSWEANPWVWVIEFQQVTP